MTGDIPAKCLSYGDLEEMEASKALLSSTFSQRLPRRRKSLTVQGDFGKIIDVVRRKFYCLSLYLGNVGLIIWFDSHFHKSEIPDDVEKHSESVTELEYE